MTWTVAAAALPIVTARAIGSVSAAAAAMPHVEAPAQGPPGPPGRFDDFTFVQPTSSAGWTVNHNLGRRPDITVMDSGGQVVFAAVVHVSNNQALIEFSSPQTGSARCI